MGAKGKAVKSTKAIRPLSLVKFATHVGKSKSKMAKDMPMIFLGEIPNMPEHGVFIGHKSGHVYSGYHIFDFVELQADEI